MKSHTYRLFLYGLALLVLSCTEVAPLSGVVTSPGPELSSPAPSSTPDSTPTPNPVSSDRITPEALTPEGGNYPTPEPEATTLTVARVVDGDTIHLSDGRTRFSVRLIGIDTPETVHPTKGIECFGPEASAFLKGLLVGKAVSYGTDPTQGATDKYGRGLGYIWHEGRLINQEIILRGLGREYTYSKPYRYQREFKAAEANARSAKIGIWSGACPSTEDFTTRTESLDGPALIDSADEPEDSASSNINSSAAPSTNTGTPSINISPEPLNICGPGMVWVNGYYRKDGRYVKGYCRRK